MDFGGPSQSIENTILGSKKSISQFTTKNVWVTRVNISHPTWVYHEGVNPFLENL
jgi:hypothetical protein